MNFFGVTQTPFYGHFVLIIGLFLTTTSIATTMNDVTSTTESSGVSREVILVAGQRASY
jgi:hypothetical protein